MPVIQLTGPDGNVDVNDLYVSRSGRFVIVGNDLNVLNTIQVFEVVDDTYVSRPVNDPTSNGWAVNGADISPDGTYVGICSYATNLCRILKWNGVAYVGLVTLTITNCTYASACNFSEDGNKFVAGGWTELRVYNRVGDVFTLSKTINNTGTGLNGISVEEARFSHDGNFLAVGAREGIKIFYIGAGGTTYTLRFTDISSGGWGVEWSYDDAHIVSVCVAVGAGTKVYQKTTGSGSTQVFVALTGDLGSVIPGGGAQSIGGWGIIKGEECLLLMGAGDGIALTRSSTYASGTLFSDLGMPGYPRTSDSSNFSSFSRVSGDNEIILFATQKFVDPYLEVFRFETEPTLQLSGDVLIGGFVVEGELDSRTKINGDTLFGGLVNLAFLGENEDVIVDGQPWVIQGGYIFFEPGQLGWNISSIEDQWIGGLNKIGGFVVEGNLRQRYEIEGDTLIGGLQSWGFLNNGINPDLFGDTLIGGLSSDGILRVATQIYGETLIGGLLSEGNLQQLLTISGDTLIGGLLSDGNLQLIATLEGDTLIGGLQTSGFIDATVLYGETLIGGLISEGELQTIIRIEGDTLIGGLVSNGQLERVLQIDSNLRIGGLQTSGLLEIRERRRRSVTVVHTL